MRTESRELFLPVSAATAYEYLLDYRNDVTWRDEITRVELVEGDGAQPGTKYKGTLVWNGLDVSHDVELVEAKPDSTIRIVSDSPNLKIDVRYALDDGEESCLLTVTYRLGMTGPLVVLEPFGWALFMGWVNDDLPRLQKTLTELSES